MVWEVRPVSVATHLFSQNSDPILIVLNQLTEEEGINSKTITIDRNPALQGQVRIYYYKEDE